MSSIKLGVVSSQSGSSFVRESVSEFAVQGISWFSHAVWSISAWLFFDKFVNLLHNLVKIVAQLQHGGRHNHHCIVKVGRPFISHCESSRLGVNHTINSSVREHSKGVAVVHNVRSHFISPHPRIT